MSSLNFEVIKERNALIIFMSQLITSVADKMLSLGLIWYVTKNLGANNVPWFLTCAFLPHLIFSFFTTKIIHKLGTIKTMLYSSAFRGVVLLIYFILLSTSHIESHLFSYSLFLMIFLIGIGSSVFTPAVLSCPPLLVKDDKIIALNGLLDSTLSISNILGAALSVFLLNYISIEQLILLNSVCFFIAVFMQFKLKTIHEEDSSSEIKEHVSPLSVLKKYSEIAKMLMVFLIFNIVLTPIFVLIPWYVEKIYLGDSSSLALIEGGLGLGAFLMGLFISLTHVEVSAKNRVKMIAIICFLFGVFFTLFSFSKHTWQGASILFLIGAASTFLNIQVLTFFQTGAEETDVPAIMTSVNLISNASMPLSLTFSGLIFPYVNVPSFALWSGALVIVLAFILPPLISSKPNGSIQ